MLPVCELGYYQYEGNNSHPSQVLVVAQSTSVLFALWFTIVRNEMLIMVKGGVSLGAVASLSEYGLTSLGSLTLNSTLHHDIWRHQRHSFWPVETRATH